MLRVSIFCFLLLSFAQVSGYDQSLSLAKEVLKWNEAVNNQTSSFFLLKYDGAAIYYTEVESPEGIYASKVQYIDNHQNYQQEIISDIEVVEYPLNRFLCKFQKRVYQDGQEFDYPSYLVFDLSDKPKIIEEGDEVTNMNRGYSINYGKKVSSEIIELQPLMDTLGIESVKGMQSQARLRSIWKNLKLILLILGGITAVFLILRALQNVIYGVCVCTWILVRIMGTNC